jgi:hypothetical protein
MRILRNHSTWSSDRHPACHACVLRSNPGWAEFSFANASAFTVALFSLATVLLCESKLIEDRAVKLARARAKCAQCMEKTYGNPRARTIPFWCNNLLSHNSTVDIEFLNFKNASVLHALAAAASKLRAGASSTVTLDIDIRENVYFMHRTVNIRPKRYASEFYTMCLLKKKCLYIYMYKYCDLNFENIGVDYG